jgi:hypothetical protein
MWQNVEFDFRVGTGEKKNYHGILGTSGLLRFSDSSPVLLS